MGKLYIPEKYGQTPNKLLNNSDITLKAKGLFGFLQSKPNGWKFSAFRISKQTKDGPESVRTALKELEENGCLKRKAVRDENGKWNGYDYYLLEPPKGDKPSTDNPSSDKPSTENHITLSKKDISKKDISNKEIDIAKETFAFSEQLLKMEQDSRHIQIIALYWKYKEFNFDNKEQYQSSLKRDLKPASVLKGYSNDKISRVMAWLDKNMSNIKWTLETIHKYIDEDLSLYEEKAKQQYGSRF